MLWWLGGSRDSKCRFILVASFRARSQFTDCCVSYIQRRTRPAQLEAWWGQACGDALSGFAWVSAGSGGTAIASVWQCQGVGLHMWSWMAFKPQWGMSCIYPWGCLGLMVSVLLVSSDKAVSGNKKCFVPTQIDSSLMCYHRCIAWAYSTDTDYGKCPWLYPSLWLDSCLASGEQRGRGCMSTWWTYKGCSESNASYFILLAHIRGGCWWCGGRGWTSQLLLCPAAVWQMAAGGSLKKMVPDMGVHMKQKCHWIPSCGINGTHWHSSMLAECCKQWMRAHRGSGWCLSAVATADHLCWCRFLQAQHAGSCSSLVKIRS